MAQTGYTPIQLYQSSTAANVPTSVSLLSGELAINTTDGKLFYKDSGGTVQVIASKSTGSIGGANTYVQYNNANALAGSANLTFNGTTLGVTGNITATNVYANSGTIGASLLTGTVTTNAQPNITSVGTLSSLTVSGNSAVSTQVTINDTNPAAGSNKTFAIGGGSQQFAVVANITNGSYNSLQTTGDIAMVLTGATLGNVGFSIVPWASAASGIRISSVSNIATITLGATTTNVTGLLSVTGNISTANVTATGYHIRSVGTAIAAAGTTQGTATVLTKEINIVSTVLAGNGVVLPTAVAGMVVVITNTNGNSLLVYPATGATINALAVNAALTQTTGATLQFVAPTATQWYSVGATYA